MDLENTLSNGQHPSTAAKITKMNNIPCREGIGPLTNTPKPCTTFSTVIDVILPEIREEPPKFSSDKSRGGC
jgi:hypothetical protein